MDRRLELDIVAREAGQVVFIEVKTRDHAKRAALLTKGKDILAPAYAAFTRKKQAHLVRAAGLFLTEQGLWDMPCRFDLICIERGPDCRPTLEHYTNVIELGHAVDSCHSTWQPW